MSRGGIIYFLISVVAVAAAVLSFAALDALGRLCGFGSLSLLLPVVFDTGAVAGTVAWLVRTGPARRFGRAVAVVLLIGSVAGNAFSHALTAYGLTAPWPAVVGVSAVPPAVLAALVHLAVLVAQDRTERPEMDEDATAGGTRRVSTPRGDGRSFSRGREELGDATEKGVATADAPAWSGWETAPTLAPARTPEGGSSGIAEDHFVGVRKVAGQTAALGISKVQVSQVADTDHLDTPNAAGIEPDDRQAELLASGAGRVVLARELNLSSAEARRLVASRKSLEVPGDLQTRAVKA